MGADSSEHEAHKTSWLGSRNKSLLCVFVVIQKVFLYLKKAVIHYWTYLLDFYTKATLQSWSWAHQEWVRSAMGAGGDVGTESRRELTSGKFRSQKKKKRHVAGVLLAKSDVWRKTNERVHDAIRVFLIKSDESGHNFGDESVLTIVRKPLTLRLLLLRFATSRCSKHALR